VRYTSAMKKKWRLVLFLLILLLAVAMSMWVKGAQRSSIGQALSFEPQPTVIPTVTKSVAPGRSLLLVDFFAGY